MRTKHCPSCGETKPAADFTPWKQGADGLYCYCRPCARERVRRPAPVVVDLDGEEWRAVRGWEGLYEVSNLGRIKVLERFANFKNRWGQVCTQRRPERIMKLTPTAHYGHLTVGFVRNGEKSRYLAHRLVCEAFHGPCPPDKQHCAHWDGDPTNNRVDNLRWATVKENSEDTRRHGNLRVGERSNLSRLTEAQVLEIRAKAAAGRSGYSLGKEYGISSTGALKIINRENWKHI